MDHTTIKKNFTISVPLHFCCRQKTKNGYIFQTCKFVNLWSTKWPIYYQSNLNQFETETKHLWPYVVKSKISVKANSSIQFLSLQVDCATSPICDILAKDIYIDNIVWLLFPQCTLLKGWIIPLLWWSRPFNLMENSSSRRTNTEWGFIIHTEGQYPSGFFMIETGIKLCGK